jgi:hypothetical protein
LQGLHTKQGEATHVATLAALKQALGCSLSTIEKAKQNGLLFQEKGGYDVAKAREEILAQGLRVGGASGATARGMIALKKATMRQTLRLLKARLPAR